MRILILHPGALGDLILSLPALGELRRTFPRSSITVAGNLDHVPFVAHGYADEFLSLATVPLHHLYRQEPIPQEAVRFWRSFDRIVSWTGAGDGIYADNLKALCAEAVVAAWKPAPGERRHVSAVFLDTLRPWLAFRSDAVAVPAILVDKTDEEAADAWLREREEARPQARIALHPGAGSSRKRWPLDRFGAVAARFPSLILEGPAEEGIGAELTAGLPAGQALRVQSPPTGLLAALLRRCSAFLGNDSGVTHLAAGLGIPTIAIFGPTLPENWAPRGPHVRILREASGCAACAGDSALRHSCLENISVDRCQATLSPYQGSLAP